MRPITHPTKYSITHLTLLTLDDIAAAAADLVG
jgi:hypothetical protein